MALSRRIINRRIRSITKRAARLGRGYRKSPLSTRLNPGWEKVDALTGLTYFYDVRMNKKGRLKEVNFLSLGKSFFVDEASDIDVQLKVGNQGLLFRSSGSIPGFNEPLVKTLESICIVLENNPASWQPQVFANILDEAPWVAPSSTSTYIANNSGYYGITTDPATFAFA